MITDEQRESILGCIELCERFGMEPTVGRLEGFTGLRLTQAMIDEAMAPQVEPEPEPEWEPQRAIIDGVKVKSCRVIPAPENTPGRNTGYNWIPGLKHGDFVWHRNWGKLQFMRWDGGYCVTRHTADHYNPNAPTDYPRMGMIPKGSRFVADPHELWQEDI